MRRVTGLAAFLGGTYLALGSWDGLAGLEWLSLRAGGKCGIRTRLSLPAIPQEPGSAALPFTLQGYLALSGCGGSL